MYSNSQPSKGVDNSRPQTFRIQSSGARRWRRVSCTLRENGELKLYSDTDVTLVSTVQLSQLSSMRGSAIRPLRPRQRILYRRIPSVHCFFGCHVNSATHLSVFRIESLVRSLDSFILRAFTVPQLYGPKVDTLNEEGALSPSFGTQDMFRMEKSLVVKVMEARMTPPVSPKVAEPPSHARPSSATASPGGYLVEVLLDGETRARTVVKGEGHNPFWSEEFEFFGSSCTSHSVRHTQETSTRPPETRKG